MADQSVSEGAAETTSGLALELPEGLSFKEWESEGARLGKARSRSLWLIGDWWRYADKRYDSRRYSVPDHFGVNYRSCENYAVVARAFDSSRRRENVSFAHHREVATLPSREADELLDWCLATVETNGRPRSRQELRDEMLRRQVAKQSPPPHFEVHDLPAAPNVVKLLIQRPETPAIVRLDNSGVTGRVPEELAGLTVEPPEPPRQFDRGAIARAALAKLNPDEFITAVNEAIAERAIGEQRAIRVGLMALLRDPGPRRSQGR
jgi:hypothetical protein